MNDALHYYAAQGPIADPHQHGRLFDGLPDDIASLCRTIQGLLLHYGWTERYGVRLTDERLGRDAQLRRVSKQLERMAELSDRPLTEVRAPASRLLGCCRDFSTLLTAILRHKGVPARARCGFATYFGPGHYEDHWVCQYWKAGEERWVMVDAQLDQLQREVLDITFDTTDMPEGLFLPAGQGWRMCRSGTSDPETFGFSGLHFQGMWFIRGNLIRDLLSLNKIEPLAWDAWGLAPTYGPQDVPSEQIELLDNIASVTQGTDPELSRVRSLYEAEEQLHAPVAWTA
jgi:hypothetical protein